jgi:hypothetical protein
MCLIPRTGARQHFTSSPIGDDKCPTTILIWKAWLLICTSIRRKSRERVAAHKIWR